jgi:hypothetical protein
MADITELRSRLSLGFSGRAAEMPRAGRFRVAVAITPCNPRQTGAMICRFSEARCTLRSIAEMSCNRAEYADLAACRFVIRSASPARGGFTGAAW